MGRMTCHILRKFMKNKSHVPNHQPVTDGETMLCFPKNELELESPVANRKFQPDTLW